MHGYRYIGMPIHNYPDYICDFRWQRTAVRIAKRQDRCAGSRSSIERGERIFGVAFVSIKEVLCVEDRLPAVIDQIFDRVVNHFEILIERYSENLSYVHIPRFAEKGDRRGLGFDEFENLRIFSRSQISPAGAAECRELGGFKPYFFGQLEELDIFGIGAWPSAFDVCDAECIEFARDLEFLFSRETNPLALGPVTKCCIINCYFRNIYSSSPNRR